MRRLEAGQPREPCRSSNGKGSLFVLIAHRAQPPERASPRSNKRCRGKIRHPSTSQQSRPRHYCSGSGEELESQRGVAPQQRSRHATLPGAPVTPTQRSFDNGRRTLPFSSLPSLFLPSLPSLLPFLPFLRPPFLPLPSPSFPPFLSFPSLELHLSF